MTDETRRHELTKKRLVYEMPGADAVTVRRDVQYRTTEAGALTLDVYAPPDGERGARTPAVVFVIGYSDVGARTLLGCRFKEMESFVSWARLAAASGLVAITYATGNDPASDTDALFAWVRQNAALLGVDEDRVGLWACSGHVPTALAVLTRGDREYLRCAVLCYGFMLDLDGSTAVADAAATFRFVNPSAGRSVDDLPEDLPLFVARAGRDEFPRLNETIDAFLQKALARNLPLTLVNHPEAPHAFDLLHESETSREVIRQVLAFMRFHLLA